VGHNIKTNEALMNLDEANDKLGVEHKDGLVFPRVLAVQVDAVQHVLDQHVCDDGQQDSVFEPKYKLKSIFTNFG